MATKSNAVVQTTLDRITKTITTKVIGATGDALVLRISDVSSANQELAMYKGFIARIVDMAAIPADKTTGKAATPQQKYDAMVKGVNHLNSGSSEWNLPRGETSRKPAVDVEYQIQLEAFCIVKGLGTIPALDLLDKLAKKYERDTKTVLAKLATGEKMSEAIAVIRATRLEGFEVDADEMLSELDEDGDGGEEAPE